MIACDPSSERKDYYLVRLYALIRLDADYDIQ